MHVSGKILVSAVVLAASVASARPGPPARASHGNAPVAFSRPEVKNEISSVAACLATAEIDTNKFTRAEVAILDTIVAGGEPSFADVTSAWISAETSRYNDARNAAIGDAQFRNALRDAAKGAKANYWTQLKTHLTEYSRGRVKAAEYFHNEAYPLAGDSLFAGRGQSHGLTVLMHLAARASWSPDQYRQFRPVVLLSDGHAMPGILTGARNQQTLTAIETMVAGDGVWNLGDVKDLAKRTPPSRVIDAEMFALLEIFAGRLPAKIRACWINAALTDTGARYGVDVAASEKRLQPKPEVGNLSFGTPPPRKGDLRRVELKVVDEKSKIEPFDLGFAPGPAKTLDEVIALIRADGGNSPLREKTPVALRAELTSLEKESLATWRTNKESRNVEVGTSSDDLRRLNLSDETREALAKYLAARTDATVPVNARKASTAVFEARAEVQKLSASWLRHVPEADRNEALSAAAIAARTAALRAPAREREAVLEKELNASLGAQTIGNLARKDLVPAMRTLEMKRFEADLAWAGVILTGLPDLTKALPATPPRR